MKVSSPLPIVHIQLCDVQICDVTVSSKVDVNLYTKYP